MKYFDNYQTKSKEEEQRMFCSLLYHDSRNGQIIRMMIDKKGNVKQIFSSFEREQLLCTGTENNVYVSVNTFRGRQRTADKLFNRAVMFIDLDAHQDDSGREYTAEQIGQIKKATQYVLERAYDCGDLAVPTCITDTGRGIGIYYVLENSIANASSAQKSLAFFQRVYDRLVRRYKEILDAAGTDLLEPDFGVRDAARIARMPGTVNQHTGTYCRLISVNRKESGEPLYYDLKGIIDGSKLYQNQKKDLRKPIRFTAHVNPFLETRVKRLEKLQEMRGDACTGKCRETMCFIVYSALVQINGREEAADLLGQFNQNFTAPLPEKEIRNIVKETDRHVVPEGRYKGAKGFYPYSDYAVVQALGMTDEECAEIGFGRSWQRQKQKEENQKKKAERNAAIVEAILEHPETTYQEIAESVGVSARTVERVAKKYKVNRYRIKAEEPEQEEYRPEESRPVLVRQFPSGETVKLPAETDKKCIEYIRVCVPEEVSAPFLLSPAPAGYASVFVPLLTRLLFRLRALFARNSSLRLSVKMSLSCVSSPAEYGSYSIPASSLPALCRDLAVLLTTVKSSAGLLELQKTVPAKTPKKQQKRSRPVSPATASTSQKRTVTDPRFDLIDSTREYRLRLDPDVYKLIRRAFRQIRYVKRSSFLINSKPVPTADIRVCFDAMTYTDIVRLTERISRCPKPENPFYYVMKCVWCCMHPEDSLHLQKPVHGDSEAKNTFHNFDQRKYTDEEYERLEAVLFKV